MPKNIVILSDGTGNELKLDGITNVVRTFSMLEKGDPSQQLAWYDPGVGTLGSPGALSAIGRNATKVLGLAFGYGLRANVAEAYAFLMEHHEQGDKVFLFGFSRGAYTVRAVAGLVSHVGLLPRGAENLIPYAMKIFWKKSKNLKGEDFDLARDFSERFARPDFQRADDKPGKPDEDRAKPQLTYLGVWDTVKAVGSLRRQVVLPYSASLWHVAKVRHALAIDETRRNFKVNYLAFDRPPGTVRRANKEFEECWFAGIHSDVGGNHPLGDIALQWVVRGAIDEGLVVNGFEPFTRLPRDRAMSPIRKNGRAWALLGLKRRNMDHGELAPLFVHESVRFKTEGGGYRPKNLPDAAKFTWEPWPHGG